MISLALRFVPAQQGRGYLKLRTLLLLACLWPLSALGQTISGGGLAISCNAVTTTGACTAFALAAPGGALPGAFTWQTQTTGSPGSISVTFEGSIDGTTWTTLDTSTATAGEIRSVTGKPMRQLRCNVGTLSGGASPSVTCQFTVTTSSAGGGGAGSGGTVTHTGGALTNNAVVLGAGAADTKVSTGITTNGASELDLGVAGGAVGVLGQNGSTSGKCTQTVDATATTITDSCNRTVGGNQLTATFFLGTGGGANLFYVAGNSNTTSFANSEVVRFTTSNNAVLGTAGVGLSILGSAANASILAVGTGVGGAAGNTGGFTKSAQVIQVTAADVTCGTGGTLAPCTSLTTITGLSATLPLVAANWSFTCDLVVSQATAAAADQIGIQTATNGATNMTAGAEAFTAAAVVAANAITDVASTTTAQSVLTFTPGATGTKVPIHLHGTLEGVSASGTVFNVMVLTGAAADLLTIYRGSSCWLY